MKKLILFSVLLSSAFYLPAQDCSDLFFSEYLEGTGNNKGVEIFNPTDKTIDLGKYWVVRYSNGSSVYTGGGYTQLEGFIEPYTTFVLVNGQTESTDISPACDPAMQALATMLDHDYPAPTYMNGNDAIALLKSEDKILAEALPVDLIGEIGLGALIEDETGWSNIKDTTATYNVQDVGETQGKIINYIVQDLDINGQNFGPFWLSWTSNHTLVRKPSVKAGVTDNPEDFIVDLQWDTVPGGANQWDSLNAHSCDCTPAVSLNEIENLGQIQIFPNPVNEGIMTLHATHRVISYEILGITGQLLRAEHLPSSMRTISIDTDDMRSGLYFLRARFAESKQPFVRKFVIQ